MIQKEENTLLQKQGLESRAEADERRRVYLTPTAVIWEAGRVSGSKALLENRSVQVGLHNSDCCTLTNDGAAASILLDYGKELAGGLMLSVGTLCGAEEVRLRIRFGESATEAMSEPGGPGGATNDHACRDWTISVRQLSMTPVGETGFRFVRIDLLTEGAGMQFCAAKAILLYRDIPYLGSFSCSDPLLNRIWETGAYTVHLNMQQYIWDGVKRDRLVWIGDLHPELSTIQAVFGDQQVIRDSLDLVTSQTPADQWMNDIPTYSMWWIVIQHDYYMQFGDRAYLARQLPYLKKADGKSVRAYRSGRKGLYAGKPVSGLADEGRSRSSRHGDPGAAHSCGAGQAAGSSVRLARKHLPSRQSPTVPVCCNTARSIVHPNRPQHWPRWQGLLDAADANETILKKGGAAGLCCFMGYYVLLAQAAAQDYAGALDMLRAYWGGMLRLGATTFWEDFDLRWMENAAPIDRLPRAGEIDVHATYGKHCYRGFRHSLCHGWASGPTAWLTRFVLGVEILEPGCKKIRVCPHLDGLDWAKGSYPTPFGVIKLEHKRLPDGSIRTAVQAPPEIELVYENAGTGIS